MRSVLQAVLLAFLALSASHAAPPPAYPSRPIRVIVPTSAGGVTDAAARIVSPRLSEGLGQQIVVDNRAGAGGIIGTDTVAKAVPDGHTLLVVFDSFISNPYVFKDVPYDTNADFTPISLMLLGPQLFVVHPKLGVKTFNDFVALAKAKRVPINYATAGAASSSRLTVELFKATVHLDANLVHYKGGGPALTDLLGGHVEAMIASAGLLLPHVKTGRLTVLAVTSKGRTDLVPGVPAISEFYPQFEAQSWVGMLGPAKLPRAVTERLNAELHKALATPDVKERFVQLGFEIVAGTPDRFARWIRDESAKWGKVIREQRITAE